MSASRTPRSLPIFMSLVWLSTCDQADDVKSKRKVDSAELAAASACYKATNEARLKFSTEQISQSVDQMLSAESVLAERSKRSTIRVIPVRA